MRNHFATELEILHNELIRMGGLIEHAIENAIQALIDRNEALARAAIDFDDEVDEMERRIGGRCFKLLLMQQPVAGDLRLVSTALKMITDMERIGDQAADIGEITLRLAAEGQVKEPRHIPVMARAAVAMVRNSVDAYVNKDLNLARQVIAADDGVDDLFLQVRDELIALFVEDPAAGADGVDFLMIAKYLERIGDHAVNIAEWVVFAVSGVHQDQPLL